MYRWSRSPIKTQMRLKTKTPTKFHPFDTLIKDIVVTTITNTNAKRPYLIISSKMSASVRPINIPDTSLKLKSAMLVEEDLKR